MSEPVALFRLAYASRSIIDPARVPVEIPRILESARRSNAAQDITGALLFGADGFVQVLEGPVAAVEQTFERIQCDPRHAGVAVLEAGPVGQRDFDGWSMAFAGRQPDLQVAALGPAPDILGLLQAALRRMAGHPVPARSSATMPPGRHPGRANGPGRVPPSPSAAAGG
ncbi:BLUF domain-containing protein [Dankookia sp. GCM10030260]|uniref:BLUF domain-containing protein n=1 Tax=Dankookia sp. GCM10030260 TaxID=3273390 RepID=UPI00361C3288